MTSSSASSSASGSRSSSGLRDTLSNRSARGRLHVPSDAVARAPDDLRACLLALDRPCHVVRDRQGRVGLTTRGTPSSTGSVEMLTTLDPLPPEHLGAPTFRDAYGTRLAYSTGAMANGIASEELVIAAGRAGLLGSFGAAGLLSDRVTSAIRDVQAALPNGPYAFNLIHSMQEEALERNAVDLYLKHGVRAVEASAFMNLTPHVVRYRVAGLEQARDGSIRIRNKILAKLSRRHVARQFLSPPPERIVQQLVEQGAVTREQARLAQHVPMADDITAEADSGGHTDNRALACLLPDIVHLRDRIQAERDYATAPRVGAAGGIGTPSAAAGAFAMGADYVVTGSVNQSCVEAAASRHTKELLAEAGTADVTMAPAADMFEMGVEVQVLKRGTLFAPRAQKLYELYETYDGIDALPADERDRLETKIFRRPLDAVWEDCVSFFEERDPEQIERARQNPKRKMALIFRWYLGLSSHWSNVGEEGRETDYQAWCGPAMGAFNAWVEGTPLEATTNRRVADVAREIMRGAAYLMRVSTLQTAGVHLPATLRTYQPQVQPQNGARIGSR